MKTKQWIALAAFAALALFARNAGAAEIHKGPFTSEQDQEFHKEYQGWLERAKARQGRSLEVESVVSTNWLALNLDKASGTGPVVSEPKEIGILISNRYAVVIADNATNRILLSSQAVLPAKLLLRAKPPPENIWTITNMNRFWTIPLGITNGVLLN